MKIVGIDLAGNPKNSTGFCVLHVVDDTKTLKTSLLYKDDEIIDSIKTARPEITAIDAPLTFSGTNRKCDDLLRTYGALPVTLRGMEMLARRGTALAKKIEEMGFRFIEVFSTATAKILGLYDRNDLKMQKNLMSLELEGDVNTRFLTRDELDGILAALTGYLYLKGETKVVGDEEGEIAIPEV